MLDSFDSLVADAVAQASTHRGWDFSYLRDRRHEEPTPWSYEDSVLSLLDGVEDMLDMDTGGGERLSKLHDRAGSWPTRVTAIEAYLPNVEVARRNLAPIAVEVVPYDNDKRLPFNDASFDLIINRHGQYSATEIKRLLKPEGAFVTEQVGSDMCVGLNRLLEAPPDNGADWDLPAAVAALEGEGFEIVDQQEYRGRDVFDDIGAVVWLLHVVSWQIKDFSLDVYRDRLRSLHESIQTNGPIDVGNHHFFTVARKASVA